MKIANISEIKNKLSAYIDMVRHGETVVIIDRNHPVAQLVPVPGCQSTDDTGRLSRLERAGLLRRPKKIGKKEKALTGKPAKCKRGVSILQTLFAERAKSR